MEKWIIGVLIIVVAFVFYNNNKRSDGYQQISPAEARVSIEQDKNIVLLDVRTEEEYNEKHIPDSTLIPINVLKSEAEKQLPDKKQKIYVYCRSGNRSKTATNMLLEMGYKNVYDLGGINSWPYETN